MQREGSEGMTYEEALKYYRITFFDGTEEEAEERGDAAAASRKAICAIEKQIPSKPNEVLGLNGKEFCCPYCDEAIELIPRDKDETT